MHQSEVLCIIYNVIIIKHVLAPLLRVQFIQVLPQRSLPVCVRLRCKRPRWLHLPRQMQLPPPLTQNSTQPITLDKPRVSAVSKNVLYDNYLSTHRDYPAAEFTTTLQLSALKNILAPNNTTLAAEIAQIKKENGLTDNDISIQNPTLALTVTYTLPKTSTNNDAPSVLGFSEQCSSGAQGDKFINNTSYFLHEGSDFPKYQDPKGFFEVQSETEDVAKNTLTTTISLRPPTNWYPRYVLTSMPYATFAERIKYAAETQFALTSMPYWFTKDAVHGKTYRAQVQVAGTLTYNIVNSSNPNTVYNTHSFTFKEATTSVDVTVPLEVQYKFASATKAKTYLPYPLDQFMDDFSTLYVQPGVQYKDLYSLIKPQGYTETVFDEIDDDTGKIVGTWNLRGWKKDGGKKYLSNSAKITEDTNLIGKWVFCDLNGVCQDDEPDDVESGTDDFYALHAMYRLYNPYTHEHLFTTDAAEKDNLVSLGWNFESVTGKVYMHGEKGGVYRLYNPTTGEHHYTTKEDELVKCVKAGWKNEGVKFFSVLDADKQTVGMVSMYNPYEKKFYHHYTSDADEIAKMVKDGWRKEEIEWYAAK